MLNIQKTRLWFLITISAVSLFSAACTKSPTLPVKSNLMILSAPSDALLSPGETKHFTASMSTNSTEPLHYLWQKLGGPLDTSISTSAFVDLADQSGAACARKTDSYRLIASAGPLRAEKTFSVTRTCKRNGPTRSDDVIRVLPADEFWAAPGQAVSVQATTSLQGATLKWELVSNTSTQGVSQSGQYTFTAPALSYPCEKRVYALKATATQGGVENSKTVSINVENSMCALSQANGLVSNDTTKLLIAGDGALFVGTRSGLTRFKNGQAQSATTAGNNETLQIVTALSQAGSLIFVGKARQLGLYPIRGFGVDILQVQNDSFFWNNTPLYPDNYVSYVFFNPNTPKMPEVLSAGNYTTQGGVHRSADLSFHSTSDLLKGENIYAAVDYKNQTFFGGDGGIFVFGGNSQGQQFDGTQWKGKGGLFGVGSNRSVRALAKDSNDNIWIGLQAGTFEDGGLIQYQPRTGTWDGPIALPGGQDVRALAVDSIDNLWIATDKGLVLRRPDGVFKNFTQGTGLNSSDIRDLAYSPEQEDLWIATSAGVVRWSLPQLQ